MNRTESFTDKIKSFQDLKKELKSFFTINGYSEVLSTNSLVKKVFCVLCLITLASACVYFADQNIRGYKEYNVVTQIKIIENQTITFQAVTMCLQDIRKLETVSNTFNINIFNDMFPLNLEDVLMEGFFEKSNQ